MFRIFKSGKPKFMIRRFVQFKMQLLIVNLFDADRNSIRGIQKIKFYFQFCTAAAAALFSRHVTVVSVLQRSAKKRGIWNLFIYSFLCCTYLSTYLFSRCYKAYSCRIFIFLYFLLRCTFIETRLGGIFKVFGN